MKHILAWTLTVGLAGAAVPAAAALSRELPSDPRQESTLLAAAGKGFRLHRTPHFLIAHDTSTADVKAFVTRVEQVYQAIYRFCDIHNIRAEEPAAKLEIIFFNTFAEYREYARRVRFPAAGTYGFYSDADNRAVFYNVENDKELAVLRRELQQAQQNVAAVDRQLARTPGASTPVVLEFSDGTRRTLTREKARKEAAKMAADIKRLRAQAEAYADRVNRTVVQHEVTHQVFFNAGVLVRGGFNPPWVIEGLAMLFETPPTANGSGLGVVNPTRLRDFRAAVGDEGRSTPQRIDAVLRAMEKGPFVSLQELVTNRGLFDVRGDAGSAHYAQAWALMHYLHRTRKEPFVQYLKGIAARAKSPPKAEEELAEFERFFGRIDEAFVRKWAKYILALPAPPP